MTAESEHVPNEFTQEEKRQVQRDTMHSRAVAEQGAVGGRWAAESKTTVTGAANEYLKQPPNSPWARDPVGQEPPLGFSIDQIEPVGEPCEIEQSLREAREDTVIPSGPSNDSPSDDAQRSLGPPCPGSSAPSSLPTDPDDDPPAAA
jgi:hypothetical protein